MASEAGAACPLAPQFYRHFAASRARPARKVPAPGSVSFRDYLALHPRRQAFLKVTPLATFRGPRFLRPTE